MFDSYRDLAVELVNEWHPELLGEEYERKVQETIQDIADMDQDFAINNPEDMPR